MGRLSVFENNVLVNFIEKYIERNFGGFDYEIAIDFKLNLNILNQKLNKLKKCLKIILEEIIIKTKKK